MKTIQLLLLAITALFATACSPDGLSTSLYYNSYGSTNHGYSRTAYVYGPQYYRTNVRSCGDNIINLSGTPIVAEDCHGRGNVIIPNRW